MNTNFLKKVFSSQPFLVDYMEFLKSFRRLVEEDNTKKIKYLAETIESYIAQHTVKVPTCLVTQKLEAIKRLPWTQNILEKTQDLAEKLAQHSPFQVDGLKREPIMDHDSPTGTSSP
jgi:primosomal protein N''